MSLVLFLDQCQIVALRDGYFGDLWALWGFMGINDFGNLPGLSFTYGPEFNRLLDLTQEEI